MVTLNFAHVKNCSGLVLPPHRSVRASMKGNYVICVSLFFSTCNHEPHLQARTAHRRFPQEKGAFWKRRDQYDWAHTASVYLFLAETTLILLKGKTFNVECCVVEQAAAFLNSLVPECMMGKRGPTALLGHPGCLSSFKKSALPDVCVSPTYFDWV